MDIEKLSEQQKDALVKLELRKLERDYERCMKADLTENIKNFDENSTPNLDKLKEEVKKKSEEEKKEEDEPVDEFEGLNIGYAQLGGSSDEEVVEKEEEEGNNKIDDYEKEEITIYKSKERKPEVNEGNVNKLASDLGKINFQPPKWAEKMTDEDWNLMVKKMVKDLK